MAAVFQALGLSFALFLGGCSAAEPLVTLDCSPIRVTIDGQDIVGIEDMAIADDSTLFLSAYNRRDVGASPKGLFALSISQTGAEWTARRLTDAAAPLIPHGLAFDNAASLYVIDRSQSAPQIRRYKVERDLKLSEPSVMLMASTQTPEPPYPCNLNDLSAVSNGDLLFTNDRRSCTDFGRLIDNLFGRQNGSLWGISPSGRIAKLADELYFPNGLTETSSGETLVALTRDNQILNILTDERYQVKGSPDNMIRSADGSIWGAAIPSLPRYALYRRGLTKSPGPSHIFKLEETLHMFSAPTYSGATAAAQLGGTLYLSGAYTSGIAKCEVPDAV